jgi:hypothetical protein
VTIVKKKKPKWKEAAFMCCGFDVSTSSIAGAAMAWDKTLNKWVGPAISVHRWQKTTDYFDRLHDAAIAYVLISQMATDLKVIIPHEDIYIAIEEPWAFGQIRGMQSNALKQQAEISGAFLSGLLRYGYRNMWQINNTAWRQIVAKELGITIHHSKWNPTKTEGKFRAKEWALNKYPILPVLPDLIADSKLGLIPRPEERKAKPVQSDDRYEAVAMCEWMVNEVRRNYVGE